MIFPLYLYEVNIVYVCIRVSAVGRRFGKLEGIPVTLKSRS